MSAFKVFFEHWVLEENKAHRLKVLKARQKKIKVSLSLRNIVRQFSETLEELSKQDWFMQDRPELRKRLAKLGYFLGKSQAPSRLCRFCGKSITRFHLSPAKDPEYLFIYCERENCGRTELTLSFSDLEN